MTFSWEPTSDSSGGSCPICGPDGAGSFPSGPGGQGCPACGRGRLDATSRTRAGFTAEELVRVVSHYDLGLVHQVRVFARGSRKSPKILLAAERGRYLLKRRAPGRSDPREVAFCHGVQLHLVARGFPAPPLLGTRPDANSMLELDGSVYEMQGFLDGDRYGSTVEQTRDAGRALGRFHRLIRAYVPQYPPTRGAYRASGRPPPVLEILETRLIATDPELRGREPEAVKLCRSLRDAYGRAATELTALDLNGLEPLIVHGDYHPGNLLFRGPRAAGVLDFDTARPAPAVTDVANGALQFSFTVAAGPPEQWQAALDADRLRAFLVGYRSEREVAAREAAMIAPLMVQALIVESAQKIAPTGRCGPHRGISFLRMVSARVAWMASQVAAVTG